MEGKIMIEELVRGKKRYKSRESMEREAETHFGGKRGNKRCSPVVATSIREFYRKAFLNMTQAERDEYIANETNPVFFRDWLRLMRDTATVQDVCNITNQIYGMPKQTIEKQELPPIDMSVFGICKKKRKKPE